MGSIFHTLSGAGQYHYAKFHFSHLIEQLEFEVAVHYDFLLGGKQLLPLKLLPYINNPKQYLIIWCHVHRKHNRLIVIIYCEQSAGTCICITVLNILAYLYVNISYFTDTCKIHPQMDGYMNECNEFYRPGVSDDRSYTESWKDVTNDPCPERPENDKIACPWRFEPTDNPGTSIIFGYAGTAYDGRGYIADLGTRRSTALESLRYLQEKKWMDRYTRIVLLEWVVYNANLNHFSYIAFYVEFPETNGGYPQYETHTFRLYDYSSDAEITAVVVTLLHILYIMWLIHTCFEEFENIKKAGKSYIKSVDNWAEIALVLSSMLGVIIYMIRKMAVINLKEQLQGLECKYFNLSFRTNCPADNVAQSDNIYSKMKICIPTADMRQKGKSLGIMHGWIVLSFMLPKMGETGNIFLLGNRPVPFILYTLCKA